MHCSKYYAHVIFIAVVLLFGLLVRCGFCVICCSSERSRNLGKKSYDITGMKSDVIRFQSDRPWSCLKLMACLTAAIEKCSNIGTHHFDAF